MRFLRTCRPLSGHSAKGGVLAIRELTIDPTPQLPGVGGNMDAPVPQPEAPSSGPTSSGGAGVLRSDGCQLRRLRDLYVRFGDLSQQDYEQERDNLLALRAEIEVRQEPRVASSLPIDGIWDAWQTGNQEARRNGTAAAARVGGPGQGQLGAHW